MNARMDTIKRLAESDPYWRGYLDGMADGRAIRNAAFTDDAWREYARLTEARLARAVDDVADRSEFRSLDEVRARLHARRLDRNTDTTDYDSEWRRDPPPDVIAAKKAEVRERLNARRLGLPYPARLDVDPR